MDILGFFNSVLKIALGILLAFVLYMATVKLIVLPLMSSGGSGSSINSIEHKKEDRNSATLIERMKKDRDILDSSLKRETINLEDLEEEAAELRTQVDPFPTRHPKLNELVENLLNRTKALNPPTVNPSHASTRAKCSKESKDVLDAWLQLLPIYAEFELDSVKYDKEIIKELLFSKSRLLNSLTPNQVKLFKPVTKQLLEYHKIVTSKDNWQSQIKNLEMIANAKGAENSIENIYKLGYPKSDNPCFTTQLSLEKSIAPMTDLSNITLEKWFYTFWVRRFSEGTMAATHLGLKLLDLSMMDLE